MADKKHNPIEHALETILFASRWIMAPFYLGLILALFILMVIFLQELVTQIPQLFSVDETAVIVWILTLIDLSLSANLVLMVIFSGYENFVSKMEVSAHPDRPPWMGKVDFGGMKLKLIASIVAISAIHLLKAFMAIETYDKENMKWLVIVHMTFVISGLLLAATDWVSERTKGHTPE